MAKFKGLGGLTLEQLERIHTAHTQEGLSYGKIEADKSFGLKPNKGFYAMNACKRYAAIQQGTLQPRMLGGKVQKAAPVEQNAETAMPSKTTKAKTAKKAKAQKSKKANGKTKAAASK